MIQFPFDSGMDAKASPLVRRRLFFTPGLPGSDVGFGRLPNKKRPPRPECEALVSHHAIKAALKFANTGEDHAGCGLMAFILQ